MEEIIALTLSLHEVKFVEFENLLPFPYVIIKGMMEITFYCVLHIKSKSVKIKKDITIRKIDIGNYKRDIHNPSSLTDN